jgi:CheY-like chemotaxis protein
VSHELRTPLNAVLGLAQVCRNDPLLTEQGRAHATRIEAAGQHLLALVNDLIDLSRVETGRVNLTLEAVPVLCLIEDSLGLVAGLAQARGVQLLDTAHLPGIEAVQADQQRLRQVMSNLLSNAVKYNRQGGTVQVSCGRGDAGLVRLSVIDTGQGIATKLQPRLFSAFDRLGAERGLIEGTGIGLVITHRLVQAMGGQMGFESKPGQGSVFWLDLPPAELAPDAASPALSAPVAKPDSADALATQLLARATAAARPKRLVLYVEDNPVNTLVMQEILAQRADVRQRHAATGEEGLAMAIEEPPDLVLMDINLPGMDGYEALAALRASASTAHVPVLAVSANAMMGDEDRALDAGFAGYVVKPVDVAALHAQIDRLLNPMAVTNAVAAHALV